ncbi:hypothetical protein Pint_07738 [Pistacia integerrima]|uniref:Uncharacterized protein n=1 Tax=Pistacia integerrima TaxID=434235 RepID=A0ACC0XYC6_9ROSI|nr:hypothetical protein Pint_07738 [Pistacia integerrima]
MVDVKQDLLLIFVEVVKPIAALIHISSLNFAFRISLMTIISDPSSQNT